jgi:hypothetical protein
MSEDHQTILIFLLLLISPFAIIGYLVWDVVRDLKKLAAEDLIIDQDSLMVVENIPFRKVMGSIEEFKKNYDMGNVNIPTQIITDSALLIRYPSELGFENFCYFLSYLSNEFQKGKKLKVIGWVKSGKSRKLDKFGISNRRIMVFAKSKESTRVYLTTEIDQPYEFDFSAGMLLKKTSYDHFKYMNLPIKG